MAPAPRVSLHGTKETIKSRFRSDREKASERHRASSEAKALAKQLRLLQNPDAAAAILLSITSCKRSDCFLDAFNLDSLRKGEGWIDNAELEMAKLLQERFDNLKRSKSGARTKSKRSLSSTPTSLEFQDSVSALMTSPTATAPLVSDSESAQEDEAMQDKLTLLDFWTNLLESVQLRVYSKLQKVAKKQFHVYRLEGTLTLLVKPEEISSRIRNQLLETVFPVRVHSTWEDQNMWVQITSGKKMSPCVLVLQPDSNLVAVTVAAKSEFVSAVESALTRRVGMGKPKSLSNMTSLNPVELLRTAQQLENNRYHHVFLENYAAETNPVEDLATAADGCLLDRATEDKRLRDGVLHGRSTTATDPKRPGKRASEANFGSGRLPKHTRVNREL